MAVCGHMNRKNGSKNLAMAPKNAYGKLPLKLELPAKDYGALEQYAGTRGTTGKRLVEDLVESFLFENRVKDVSLPTHDLSETEFCQLVTLRRNGKTVTEISTAIGLPYHAVKEAVDIHDDAHDRIRCWYGRGVSSEQIALRIGWPQTCVRTVLADIVARRKILASR